MLGLCVVMRGRRLLLVALLLLDRSTSLIPSITSTAQSSSALYSSSRNWVSPSQIAKNAKKTKKKTEPLAMEYFDEERQEPIVRQVVPVVMKEGSTLYEGDYAIHFERGVCVYAGRWQEGEGEAEEWPVLLRFADRVVAVPASDAREQLSLLKRGNENVPDQNSIGGPSSQVSRDDDNYKPLTSDVTPAETVDGVAPKLSKLKQPRAWLTKRQKAIDFSKEHARELVAVAAARVDRERQPCEPLLDTSREVLNNGLGFTLTDGQERCIADVEEDMCRRTKPMDRLVFGDVGYGKTEVALRAIATAVQNGRQVALVAPTTILATQHFHTLRERLAPLGFNVELLLGLSKAGGGQTAPIKVLGMLGEESVQNKTALKPKAEHQRVRLAIASGECDVAVGTHALLSKRQTWKSLGLAVIDEEQRFGVAQKEQLKSVCVDVDVLTLSATPIPRTLGSALAGIRDCSELPKPPPGRGVTKTFVTADEYGDVEDENRLCGLLDRELSRGGQCFYVVPHIVEVEGAVKRVEQALSRTGRSDFEVHFAHGSVPNAACVIADFAAGNNETRPVLVATTLVENGLDLPKVNTIIVQDSHRFGLASLHQLRGRVGRGDRKAVACFLYPRRRDSLTPSARARLVAIADHKRQAGPELAKKDLEIRGAGALLGTRQSGKVARYIGADLYAKLLMDELTRLRALDIKSIERCVATLPVAVETVEELEAAENRQQVLDFVSTISPEALSLQVKAAVKLRLLECHAASLGFDAISLDGEDPAASAFISSPSLDPPTWNVLKREVPETLRASLRYDQPRSRIQVVRLGTLEPLKQLDFLLEVLMRMTTFVDRLSKVNEDEEETNKEQLLV